MHKWTVQELEYLVRDFRNETNTAIAEAVGCTDQDVRDKLVELNLSRTPVARRRIVDPTTCEKEYSAEDLDFMRRMDDYKRHNRRPFPTWSEVLEVLKSMGYRKVAAAHAVVERS